MSSDARGELYVLSAPSAAGKTTLLRRLLKHPLVGPGLAYSVSWTTRAPRSGEIDGVHYHFVDRERFEDLIAADRFLEWAVVHDHLYGTSRDTVEEHLERGLDVVVEIDVQGATQVQARVPEATGVFVLPPSYAELERRLRGREQDGAEQIELRLRTAIAEIECWPQYDYVIVNDQLDRAVESLAAIFLARRCRRTRMRPRVAQALADLPGASPEPDRSPR